MKIAIIRKKYTFHGGAEGILHDIISRLAADGHEVHIFAIEWSQDMPAENVHFHRVPAITFNSFLRDVSFVMCSYFMMRKNRHTFDLIQTHDKTLFQDICFVADGCHIEWLKQRWRRKGVLGKLSISLNPYHWLTLFIERAMYKGQRCRNIFALSQSVKKDIVSNYKTHDDRINVVYHWIDTRKFHPDNRRRYRERLREYYSIDSSDFVIIFVGSGFERKGLEFLIKSVELISKPLTVLVVGKGSERKYRNLTKKQRVIFCGPQEDIHKYYAAADIFIVPSIYEPLGLVYIEALASGLPVIATENCGAAEIIKDGVQGFVVPNAQDINGIAEKILILEDNKAMRDSMSIKARQLAEEFTYENYIHKVKNLYEEILAVKHT